jgi:hypothetical protein
MDFNEAVETALKTWYPKDHDLHLNPHHPLGKLLGEWGELMEDQMKIAYKPNYAPETEKELGDIWYYIRILAYQTNRTPQQISSIEMLTEKSTEYLISYASEKAAKAYQKLEDYGTGWSPIINISFSLLLKIASRYNLTLDNLTASNWQKLKPGSVRGDEWAKGRVQTDYKGGKIGLK